MDAIDLLTEQLLDEACEDEVGLWLIVAQVRADLGLNTRDEVERATMSIVQRMLASGRVEALLENPEPPGRSLWNGPETALISHILREWVTLGRDPSIAEIVAFVAKSEEEMRSRDTGFHAVPNGPQ